MSLSPQFPNDCSLIVTNNSDCQELSLVRKRNAKKRMNFSKTSEVESRIKSKGPYISMRTENMEDVYNKAVTSQTR